MKQQPINTGGSNSTNTNKEAKPFESSYYFAHNKHSTGGGYTDGLKASDYVMNGPRLLSKGGVRIEDDKDTTTTTSDSSNAIDNNGDECSEGTKYKQSNQKLSSSSTLISKYMWDDDGSSNIAKIHIDTLPVSALTKTIPWESAGIVKANVDCRLIGDDNEGLYISISQEVDQGGKRYHLYVPKMYGEADSVKCIVKKHKLLVKLYKRSIPKYSNRYKKNDSLWDTTTRVLGNYITGKSEKEEESISIAWPRLSASSVGGLGGGTAVIDEKIFKDMDTSKPTSGGMFDM